MDAEKLQLPALVFVRRRAEADEVAQGLAKESGLRIASSHGGHSKGDRELVLTKLQAGLLDVVVCTDILSTGVDIPELGTVIDLTGGKASNKNPTTCSDKIITNLSSIK